MNEFFKQEPEPQHAVEFREYLAREYGITGTAHQDIYMEIFREKVLSAARKTGLIPMEDPIEMLRQQLIDQGITDREEQKPILCRFYQDHEDPRPKPSE